MTMVKNIFLIFAAIIVLFGCSKSGDSSSSKLGYDPSNIGGAYFRLNNVIGGTYYQEYNFKNSTDFEMIVAFAPISQTSVTYIIEKGKYKITNNVVEFDVNYFTCSNQPYKYTLTWAGNASDIISFDEGAGEKIVLKSYRNYVLTGFDMKNVNALNEDRACTFFSKMTEKEKKSYALKLASTLRLPASKDQKIIDSKASRNE